MPYTIQGNKRINAPISRLQYLQSLFPVSFESQRSRTQRATIERNARSRFKGKLTAKKKGGKKQTKKKGGNKKTKNTKSRNILHKINKNQTTGKKIKVKDIDIGFFLTTDGERFNYMQNRTPSPSPTELPKKQPKKQPPNPESTPASSRLNLYKSPPATAAVRKRIRFGSKHNL